MRKKPPPTHDYTDADRGERLQKVLARAGVASRRACEELIESGEVMVNGQPVTSMPAWVDPRRDRITVGGRPVHVGSSGDVYVMLFKPRGVLSTNADPEGRSGAIDLVQHPSRARLYAAGRLDLDSSGLLLLTNDGELANRLTHPRHEVHKTYEITVDGSLDEEAVAKLQSGLFLPDRRRGAGSKTGRSRLHVLKRDRDRTRLLMELREGRNRQIRRMMLRLGHRVKKLRRVRMGPIKLKGLRPGQWRDLTPAEVKALKKVAYGKEATERRSDGATKGRR